MYSATLLVAYLVASFRALPETASYSPLPRRAASQRAHPLIDWNSSYPMIPEPGRNGEMAGAARHIALACD